jgi:hypothetical protein
MCKWQQTENYSQGMHIHMCDFYAYGHLRVFLYLIL